MYTKSDLLNYDVQGNSLGPTTIKEVDLGLKLGIMGLSPHLYSEDIDSEDDTNDIDNFKQVNMYPEGLKNSNPDLYNTIFNLGVLDTRNKVDTWLNSGISNKWQLREGILSGLDYTDFKAQEMKDFLEGKKTSVGNSSKNDHYAKLEFSEFLKEADSIRSKR